MQRFITAQEDIYLGVVEELKNAHKSSHWIWYIFPQLIGLGRSEYSHFYGIKNIDEAIAYTNNPLLWDRYIECCKILLDIKGHTIYEIMGFIDAVKLCSSLTLFYEASKMQLLQELLAKYYNGQRCSATLNLLKRNNKNSK